MKIINEVMHFTHTDADGVGCAVVGKRVFTHTKVEFCDYHNVDQKVKDFIHKYINEDGKVIEFCPYGMILITDISVLQDTAILLDYFTTVTGIPVYLIDHHATSIRLRDFDWAEINPEFNGVKTSGTSEMYRLLVEDNPMLGLDEKGMIGAFCEQIRLYDTWDWTVKGVNEPRYLHELLMIIGRKEWLNRFVEDINPTLTDGEQYLVDTELKRIDSFIKGKLKQMIKTELHGYQVGVVFAENHHSVLGNTMCKENPDIDFAVIINIGGAKISFRSTKDDINTGEFAEKFYGGGGHPKASGCEFNSEERLGVFQYIMDIDSFVLNLFKDSPVLEENNSN